MSASTQDRRGGVPAPRRLELARWLVGHTRELVPVLGVSILARICNQLLGVALLVVMATAVLRAGTGRPVAAAHVVVTLVVISLVKAGLRYLEHYSGHWVAFTALQRLRELFFARLVPQAPAATRGEAGAELTERGTRDIDRIEVFFAHTVPPAVSAIVVPVVALVWLGTSHGSMALAIAPFMLLIVVVPLCFGRSTWATARRVGARRGRIAAHLGDDLQGRRDVLALGAQDLRLDDLGRLDADLTGDRAAMGRIEAARAGLIRALELGALVAVVAVGRGPEVAVGLACAAGLWPAVRGVDDFVAGLDAAFAATARVRAIVDAPPVIADGPDAVVPSPGAGGSGEAARFERVRFEYPGSGRLALDGVSFSVPHGAHLCVVGVSGSGKSTLAALLLRGWDPQSGEVRVEGTPVTDVPLDWLRRHVALAPQVPRLLRGSIADNLRLGNPGADEQTLRRAAWTAALDTWLDALPEGLGTRLGERGLTVSGGQSQRLGLARALVAAPELLILDEVLSQLDAATADLVRSRLARRYHGTVLEITHRADLIPDSAPVVVLDAGLLVEQGTAGELRRAGGPFTRLEVRYG